METEETGFIKSLRIYAKYSGWFIIIAGVLVISGWTFKIEVLKSIFPSFVSMKFNTALAFVLSGFALELLLNKHKHDQNRNSKVSYFLAIIVFLTGILTLSEYLFHIDLGIDQMLFSDDTGAVATASPGRMSANTAICFVLIGLSLLLWNKKTRNGIVPGQLLALVVLMFSILGFIAYIYSKWILIEFFGSTAMAIHTAILFFILSVLIIVSRPNEGFMKRITDESYSGTLLKYLFPAIIIIPLSIEFLASSGANLGIYNHEAESVVHSLGVILVFGAAIWFGTAKIEQAEKKQKEIEEKSFNSNQILQIILDSVPQRIFWKDENSNYMGCNKPFAEDAGLKDPKEIKGKTDYDLFHMSSAELYRKDDREVIKTNMPRFQFEEPQLQIDGTKLWLRTSKVPLHDMDGYTIGLLGTYEDVTQSKLYEQSLRESEEKFRTVFQNSPLGKSMTDTDGTLRVNKSFCDILGYTEDELRSKKWQEITHPDDILESQEVINSLIENKKTNARYEKRYLHKSGHIVWTDVSTTLQRDAEGNPIFFITSINDITDRIKADEQLSMTMKNLESSNKELEQFAYVASHDLQEPLRMVSSYTQLLERRYKDQLDQDAKDFINFAVDGANRMQKLINDLLDYSRITTRGKELQISDSNAALAQAIEILRYKIESSSAIVTNDLLPAIPADEGQIVRLFQNLIDNAIKFSGAQAPKIHIGCMEFAEYWQFSVSDNGIGIGDEFREKVFVIFQRLHTRKDYPGTGIGLAICKRIVERHNGKIWIEPVLPGGTVFYFTISKNKLYEFE